MTPMIGGDKMSGGDNAMHHTTHDTMDESAYDELLDRGYVTVRAADQHISVSFDTREAAVITALLPQAGELLSTFDRIRADATAFLWNWGAEGDGSEDERLGFLRDMRPTTLVVLGSGEFAVHYEEVSEDLFLDGYWPAVHFSTERAPVSVTVEA